MTVGQSETSPGVSRVFRSFVTMEIIWTVEPGESDFRDWEGVVRDAIASGEPPAWPGLSTISEPEELHGNPRRNAPPNTASAD